LFKRSSNGFEIKGFGNDVTIIIGGSASFSDIETELIKRLSNSKQFFSGVEVVLDAGDRDFSFGEIEKLKAILTDKFNLRVAAVRSNSDITRESVEKIGWKVELQDDHDSNDDDDDDEDEDAPEEPEVHLDESDGTALIKHTLRSGQRVSYNGNVVIIGDVNPGAEIEATGDIVVMGKLRGVAHAGSEGNTSAEIIALELSPVQIRIAGYIRRPPDSASKSGIVPEVARFVGEDIIVDKLRK